MLNRRTLIGAAIAGLALASAATAALADDWKAKYPELTLAVIPAENASTTVDRYTPLANYLAKELGVPVKLSVANDYAAVIEAPARRQRADRLLRPRLLRPRRHHRRRHRPVVVSRHSDGLTGYYSVIYVKADSPYKTLDDLKGKKIALVDPNSTSGNNAPRYFLNKTGHRPHRQILRQERLCRQP